MADAWKGLALREHFIVAAPDASDSAAWNIKMDPPDFQHAVVQNVEGRHAVDGNRIYLFGHSAGAEYPLILAILDSHFYAATAVHAALCSLDFTSCLLMPDGECQSRSWLEIRTCFSPWAL
jgi:poly(3-hydroxybutyrate) depolymerase